MNLILYLYLAHFLADYPLQPGRLVEWKKKTYAGVFVHCLVHLLVLIVILAPFLYSREVWTGIAVIFATHNLIDQTKVMLDRRYPDRDVRLYFADQILHWLVIAATTFLIGDMLPSGVSPWLATRYQDQSLFLYFLMIVLVTYFYDVTRYFIVTRGKKNSPYSRDYRTMFLNVFVVSLAFVLYWAF